MEQAEVEVLLVELQSQADAERDKVREEARQKVAEIRARADAEARRIEEESARRLQRDVALDRERIHGRFRMEERRRSLEVRRKALARALERASQLVSERVRSATYGDVLKRLVSEALEAAGRDADFEVARRDADAARAILSALGGSGAVRDRGDEPGTIVAVSPDGLRKVDNSVHKRLTQAGRLLEEAVSRELFGERS